MMRTGEDERASPKYSHVERERRWLVDPGAMPALPASYVLIEDRYLRDTRFRLRRMTESATGTVALKLAKKYESDDPTARPMVNSYLTCAEYAVFAALTANPINKRRYEVDGFSVDVFERHLAGLILAEREAPDAAALTDLRTPRWSICEVTDDPRFQGGALATLDRGGVAALIGTRRAD